MTAGGTLELDSWPTPVDAKGGGVGDGLLLQNELHALVAGQGHR
jgi:hypothetical protein